MRYAGTMQPAATHHPRKPPELQETPGHQVRTTTRPIPTRPNPTPHAQLPRAPPVHTLASSAACAASARLDAARASPSSLSNMEALLVRMLN